MNKVEFEIAAKNGASKELDAIYGNVSKIEMAMSRQTNIGTGIFGGGFEKKRVRAVDFGNFK